MAAPDAHHFALRGRRLTLRIPRTGDATALFRLGRDPEVTRWFAWGPYQETAEARAYLDRLPRQRERGTQLDLLQVDDELGPVGITGLSDFHYRDRRALVGSWLAPAAWGRGINAESKSLIAFLAFELLGLERLGALADPRNLRSLRALERAGYVQEGVLRSWTAHRGRRVDMVTCSLLADEWRARDGACADVQVDGEVPGAFATLLAAVDPEPGVRHRR